MAIVVKTCECCGKPVLAKRSTRKYCSTYCQVKMFRHEQRQRKLAAEAEIIRQFEESQAVTA
ncbi:hypothetical protein ID144_23735 [Pseudomonas sp. JM0905a]|uniref:hypothetical protein n=1 Tax=Pseudomonas sp. JM0905a TaxID=2772484 RepID=UPI001686AB96|nr:hypothetical protein [Pseudomonas sp. JM0905a]MBD2840059.1 hypothetical protein [Pseudomonas sp. JM0905a]